VRKQKPLHNILLYLQQEKNSSSSSCDITNEEWGKKNHTRASSSQLLNKTNSNKCYQNPESFTLMVEEEQQNAQLSPEKQIIIFRYTLDLLKKRQSFYMKSFTVHAAQFDANLLLQSFAGCSDPLVSMCITTSKLREMHVPKYK
jgi:hypothetical protein